MWPVLAILDNRVTACAITNSFPPHLFYCIIILKCSQMDLDTQHLLFGALFFGGEILYFQCDCSFKNIITINIY